MVHVHLGTEAALIFDGGIFFYNWNKNAAFIRGLSFQRVYFFECLQSNKKRIYIPLRQEKQFIRGLLTEN